MALMILKEQGQLDFDDYVQNFLPKFPYSNVSIRHLLTHTSGIPDYEDLVLRHYLSFFTLLFFTTDQSMDNLFYTGEPGLFKDRYEILTMKDVLSLVVRYQDQKKFEPGERYSYSNTAYVLLAYIVEIVSGQAFETFLDENIFEYLGMENSSVWNLLSISDKLPNRVEGIYGNRLNDYTWLDGIAGDGAVFVSAEDFLKWDRALASHTLVSPAVSKEATTPFITVSGDTSYYGFGWRLSKEGDLMNHTGSWVGALTYISRRPKNRSMFVLLDSSTNKYYFEIRDKIIKILNDENF
jgi:CubicO group peptidase (beta-lactamase class C family)